MQRPSLRFRSEEYFVYDISEEMFTQIYRDLYGDAICYRVLLQKCEFIPRGTHKRQSDTFSNTLTV